MKGTAYREFNKLWAGRTLSQLGDRLYALGMVWWVMEKTGTPAWTGLLMLCDAVPGLIVTLFAGPWIDRWRKQRVLVAADLLRAGVLTMLGAAVILGIATPALVAATAVLLACLTAMHDPASQSILPDVVAADRLSGANARIQTTEGFCTILGPVLGGLCAAGLGFGAAVLINAATFVASALLVGMLRLPGHGMRSADLSTDGADRAARQQSDRPQPETAALAVPEAADGPVRLQPEKERYTAALAAGFRFVLARREIRRLLLVVVAAHFFTGGFSCLLPGLARQMAVAGNSAASLAWLQSLLGCGLLLGGVLHRLLPEPHSPLKRIAAVLPAAGAVLTAASLAVDWLSKASGVMREFSLPLAALACCLYGTMLSLAAIQWMTSLQKETPRAMSGRVFGLCTFAGNASMPLAYAVFGGLQAFLPTVPLLGMIGIGLLTVRLCLRAGHDLNAAPATGYDGT